MSGRFGVQQTPLPDLSVVLRKPLEDNRGYLERLFCLQDLHDVIGTRQIVQINHTLTRLKGAVRGLHFQHAPHAEMKFVSCLRGTVFDVAVDLRKDSPTFLRWHAQLLSAENHVTFAIPEGFAHGFQTLTEDCEMLYLHTAPYAPSAESGLHPLDPILAVAWPLPITDMSARDAAHAYIGTDFEGARL